MRCYMWNVSCVNNFCASDLKAADIPLQINFITFKTVISKCCDLKDGQINGNDAILVLRFLSLMKC